MLRKMQELAAKAQIDVMGQFHNALWLGDVEERVKLLQGVGQVSLAYATAATYGLTEKVEELAPLLPEGTQFKTLENARSFTPPSPVLQDLSNWPLLTVSKDFMTAMAEQEKAGLGRPSDNAAPTAVGDWDEEIPDFDGDVKPAAPADAPAATPGTGWDEDLEDFVIPSAQPSATPYVAVPTVGVNASDRWRRSLLAADHAAAGSFDTAITILKTQIGLRNADPLKPLFSTLFLSCQSLAPTGPSIPYITQPLERTPGFPAVPCLLTLIAENIAKGHNEVTEGRFEAALVSFRTALQAIALCVCTPAQKAEVLSFINTCRDYIVALRLKLDPLARHPMVKPGETVSEGHKRAAELASLFPSCNLLVGHTVRGLMSAVMRNFNINNRLFVIHFARRYLELAPATEEAKKVRQCSQEAEKNPVNTVPIDFHERNPFVICAATLKPIYLGAASIKCPFCAASFKPGDFSRGSLCPVCELSAVGVDVTGLQLTA
eukprot:gnl/Hemi2/12887_TR4402_c0_g1_i1.p1 gnl/Hemi2/12887_TR4402_c0_g1~~gnl/Hemi2/12887_TR4402_c0_g1_i1.p1  ORF type:complete len:490 (-),score=153.82 gnl/Hemi2/12887_TR4402_c0_g1_i1:97-1566(-)